MYLSFLVIVLAIMSVTSVYGVVPNAEVKSQVCGFVNSCDQIKAQKEELDSLKVKVINQNDEIERLEVKVNTQENKLRDLESCFPSFGMSCYRVFESKVTWRDAKSR